MHDFQNQLNVMKRLEIPEGVHVLSEPLFIPTASTIVGRGLSSVLSFPEITDGPCLINQNWRDSHQGDESIHLRDFVIRGGGDGLPSGKVNHTFTQGIRLQKVNSFSVRNVHISRVGFGMFIVGSAYGDIAGNMVTETGRDGIHLTSYRCEAVTGKFDRRDVKDIRIDRNTVTKTGDDCIAVHCGTEGGRNFNTTTHPDHITITNNVVGKHPAHSNAQGRGIILTGVARSLIAQNRIESTVSCGIWLQRDHHSGVPLHEKLRCRNITVMDNALIDVGQVKGMDGKPKHAILLRGADELLIKGNASINHVDHGLRAEDTTSVIWDGNTWKVDELTIKFVQ